MDIESTVQKVHTLKGHRDSVYTLQGASDNRLFFSGSGDGMVVIWDMAEPETDNLSPNFPTPFMPCIIMLKAIPDRRPQL
jgi:WD40 repeat protein